MRASIEQVRIALRCQETPQSIWQPAFDYDESHLYSLLRYVPLVPDVLTVVPVSESLLIDYTLDLQYMTIQPDLFRCLFPLCLQAWQQDLLASEGSSPYRAFVEYFLGALASRPFLHDLLAAEEYEVVIRFMQNTILDRLDQEEYLSFSGDGRVYTWFFALGAFAILFPALESLWRIWWTMETRGQVIAALQYISCLMYEEQSNPIFHPWTPEQGGGPPQLWETGAHIYNRAWQHENVAFFQSTMTPASVEEKLRQAVAFLGESNIPGKMMRDLETQRDVLGYRLKVLPAILASPGFVDAEVLWSPSI